MNANIETLSLEIKVVDADVGKARSLFISIKQISRAIETMSSPKSPLPNGAGQKSLKEFAGCWRGSGDPEFVLGCVLVDYPGICRKLFGHVLVFNKGVDENVKSLDEDRKNWHERKFDEEIRTRVFQIQGFIIGMRRVSVVHSFFVVVKSV